MTLEEIMKELHHPQCNNYEDDVNEAIEERILQKHNIVINEVMKRYNIDNCTSWTSGFVADTYQMEFKLKDSTKLLSQFQERNLIKYIVYIDRKEVINMDTQKRFLKDLVRVANKEITVEDVIKRLEVTAHACVEQLFREGHIEMTQDDLEAFKMMFEFVETFAKENVELCAIFYALVQSAEEIK